VSFFYYVKKRGSLVLGPWRDCWFSKILRFGLTLLFYYKFRFRSAAKVLLKIKCILYSNSIIRLCIFFFFCVGMYVRMYSKIINEGSVAN